MNNVCILKNVLGESANILFNIEKQTYTLCDKPPNDSWILGDLDTNFSVDVLASLSGKELRLAPPDNFKRIFDVIAKDAVIKLRQAMPADVFKRYFNNLLLDITELFKSGCIEYYENVYAPTHECLSSLDKAKIDDKKLKSYVKTEQNSSNVSTLLSFTPNEDGFVDSPVYSQIATLTGRTTVKSGPKVLTLPKKYKDIIVSRYENGKIVSLDYSSLEPRILLLTQGLNAPDDIYAYICDDVIGNRITRKQAKIVTISKLYGAADHTIGELANLKNGELRNAVDTISAYFHLSDIEKLLAEQAASMGRINNVLGRYIDAKNGKNLINHFNQSSAVDIALLGFSSGIKLIRANNWLINPLYIIHDALMLDVHPDYFQYIESIKQTCECVTNFKFKLPLHVEEI